MKLHTVLAAFFAALQMGIAPIAEAQAYPTRVVRVVVPQPAGGSSDGVGRLIAQQLSERWGNSVVIDNRPGAGGNIGTDMVAKAPADGYTLLMQYEGSYAINQWLYGKLPFDSIKDFIPVASVATVPMLLVVNANSSVKTVQDFIELAKKKEVTYASAGNGTVNHLLGEMFNMHAKVHTKHIPYKGVTPSLTDLLSGQVDAAYTSVTAVVQLVNTGKLRALAVTSAQRSDALPDVPTMTEAGLKGFDVAPWYGILAPAGTPDAIVQKISSDVSAIIKQPKVMKSLASLGAEVLITSSDQFREMARKDIAKWEPVVKASGAKLD
jgi:tripartite-type tricarboxylate transporter receptor subunit TctC